MSNIKRLFPNTRSRSRAEREGLAARSLESIEENFILGRETVPTIMTSNAPPTSALQTPPPTVNTSPNDIFNTLRIPDAIRFLPTYDGNFKTLNDFITNVEEVLMMIRGADQTPYGRLLMRTIRNKIEGRANEVLITEGIPLDWDTIRETLRANFTDKRDESSLLQEIHLIKMKDLSLTRLYEQISEVKLALFNVIETKEREQSVVKAKKESYTKLCLDAFITGVRGPLGAFIRALRPRTLTEAYEEAIKERELYFQERKRKQFDQKGSGQEKRRNNTDQGQVVQASTSNNGNRNFNNRFGSNQAPQQYSSNNSARTNNYNRNNQSNTRAIMAKPEGPDYTSGRTQMSSSNRSGQSYNINGQSRNDEQTQDSLQNFQELASEDRRDI